MFLLILLTAGVLTWLAAVAMTTWALLRPPRLTPAKAMARLGRTSPVDLSLVFEEMTFPVRDHATGSTINIAAWFLPSRVSIRQENSGVAASAATYSSQISNKTVLLVPGYADARVGALPWASVLLEIGWNVLVIDLRAHGQSGGTFTTAGLRERHDVDSIANAIRAQKPAETELLALMGLSMGAAIVLAAARERDDIAAVIADSPVAHFDHGAATQLSLMGLPGAMILKPGLRIAELILREKFATIAPAFSIARLNCPVLAILPQDDAFLPPTAATELRSAIETRADRDAISRALTFPATAHLQPLTVAKTRYTQELSAFLHEAATSLDSRRAENTVRNSPGA